MISATLSFSLGVLSVAEKVKVSFFTTILIQVYCRLGIHQSPLLLLLRPWIRRLSTTVIFFWWLWTSSKLFEKKPQINQKNEMDNFFYQLRTNIRLKTRQFLTQVNALAKLATAEEIELKSLRVWFWRLPLIYSEVQNRQFFF